MINLRTLVVGILLFCIVVASGCFGRDAPTAPEPSPTPALPPSPTATATPLPSFGPFIPLGEPVHRNLGTSTEVVRNCVPGAVDPIVKTPSRSLIASHNVEWSVAGTAGIGTSIGGGVLPVEVNLDVSLTTTYGQGYSETTERGTGWQLPAKPNTIVTYILAWGEKWQPGFVEVRLWNQPAIKIDVFYRTDVTSEIVAEDAQDCDGTRTGEPLPTMSLAPNTPLPSVATLSLSTPVPLTLSRCEITQRDFPQSIEAIAVKFNLPVAVIFDIIHENCGPSIVDGFILRSGTAVTLQVPEGGCIDAPPDAVYTEPTVSNGIGGQRAFGGTVSASAITYRVWCYK